MSTEQKTAGYRLDYDPQEMVSYRYGDLPSAARALAEFVRRYDVLHLLGFDDLNDEAWQNGIMADMAVDTILELVDEGYEPAPRPTPENPPF